MLYNNWGFPPVLRVAYTRSYMHKTYPDKGGAAVSLFDKTWLQWPIRTHTSDAEDNVHSIFCIPKRLSRKGRERETPIMQHVMEQNATARNANAK